MAKKMTKKEDNAMVESGLLEQFQADSGKGLENADKDTFAVPFILALQSNSPVVEDDLVEGAKAGKFLNSVSNELYEQIKFIPVYFERLFLHWKDRNAGGGFKGAYTPAEVRKMIDEGVVTEEDGGMTLRMGSDSGLGDTRQHYVLIQNNSGTWEPAILSMGSTQIKKSRQLMTMINNFALKAPDGTSFNPPSFARIYTAGTQKESNDKGSWYGLKMGVFTDESEDGVIQDPNLFNLAKKFYKQINDGKVTAAHETLQETETDSEVF